MPVPTVQTIIECTAAHFGMPIEVVSSPEYGNRSATYARQVAIYISRQLTYKSLRQIGSSFLYRDSGGRGGPMMNGINKISKLLIDRDEKAISDVDVITNRVKLITNASVKT